jgi:sugar lactone lactonase YvrE
MPVLLRLFTLLFLLLAPAVAAQQDRLFVWESAGLSLVYPAGWDIPLPGEQDGQPVLELAQVLVNTPADVRPPGIPIITLTILPGAVPADNSLTPFLYAQLNALGITEPDEPDQGLLLNANAPQLTGTDEQFFGIARVTPLNDQDILIVSGRAVAAQRDDFIMLFDQVASSIQSSSDPVTEAAADNRILPDEPRYGVLWRTERDQADAEGAFFNLIGLVYAPDETLYTYERDLGLVQIDARTGEILAILPNPAITQPAALAAASDGTVYVSDTDCGCIFTLPPDGTWPGSTDDSTLESSAGSAAIRGFGPGAPAQIAVDRADRLYATDVTSTNTIVVAVFENGQRVSSISLEASLFEQPLLALSPAGTLYALTQFGELLALENNTAEVRSVPGAVAEDLNALAVAADGSLIAATSDQGILILSADGEVLAQPTFIVPAFPLPGEVVAPVGVASAPDGRLFFADSDGTFGAVTAMSTTVAPGRIGAAELVVGQAVQGQLNDGTRQQTWTYTSAGNERITFTAFDNSGLGALDLALRLIDPAGRELAFNDDHDNPDLANFTDAQLADQPLVQPGQYLVIVEVVDGEGGYTLSLSRTQTLILNPNGVIRVSGRLEAAFPSDLWEFTGSAGQILTITLEATSGDLDPLLRLIGPDGSLIAENDDADDRALGTSAQIAGVSLPADGLYRLQTVRFAGSGAYELTIVLTG